MIALTASGCIGDGFFRAPAGMCASDYQQTFTPLRIDGNRLYFNPSDFSFILDPSLEISQIQLSITVSGDHHKDVSQLELDMNGTQAYSSRGAPFLDFNGYDSKSNRSSCTFHLDKMRLNGALAIDAALMRIVEHHGQLIVNLHGPAKQIVSASLTISGERYAQCPPNPGPSTSPVPSPTPSASSTPQPVAPHTTITSVQPSGSPVDSTTIAFTLSSDQAGVSFVCSLDGVAAAACSAAPTYSGLANGAHTFTAYAVGASGLTDPTGASYSWTVDTIAPSVTITNAAQLPSVTNSTSISLAFSAADSSVTTFQCAVDSGSLSACASPVTYQGLAEGAHQVSISAVDSAGNVSAPAVFGWSIDLTPPQTHFTQVDPSTTMTNSTVETFSFAADETATYECALDGASYSACVSPVALSAISEGAHLFQVRATDVAGNVGQPANYAWTVDLTPPVVTLGQVSPAAGLTNAPWVSVEFSANEISTSVCSLDGAPVACNSPYSAQITAEGNHVLEIVATDTAGNASAPVQVAWTMDFTLPQLAFGTMIPSSASYINAADFQAEVLSSESVTLSCKLNGSGLGQNASPIVLSNLAEGPYTLDVTGTDLAGNVSSSISHSFTVDLTPPAATLSATYSSVITNQTINTLQFSASEASTFECNIDSQGYSLCTSPLNLSGLAEGQHQVLVLATDLAGNLSQVQEVDWAVDFTPPVTTLSAARSLNESISFQFTANEVGSTFECSLDGGDWDACSSPSDISGLPAGLHAFSVRATDVAGNVETAPPTYAWTIDPPVTTSITSESPSAASTNVTSMTIGFASNSATATFLCSWDGGSSQPCTSPASISGLADGTHKFFVQAVDAWGTSDATGASYSWTVDTTPPVVISFTPTGGSFMATVNWTTNEPATSKVNWGMGTDTSNVVPEDSNYVTNHSVQISGLSAATVYSFVVSGHDAAGNAYTSTRKQAKTF